MEVAVESPRLELVTSYVRVITDAFPVLQPSEFSLFHTFVPPVEERCSLQPAKCRSRDEAHSSKTEDMTKYFPGQECVTLQGAVMVGMGRLLARGEEKKAA